MNSVSSSDLTQTSFPSTGQIRIQLAEAVFNELSHKEYRALAVKIAGESSLSTAQILSIGAHLKIKAKTILGETYGTPDQVRSFISLWYYLKNTETPFTNVQDLCSAAQQLGHSAVNADLLSEQLLQFDSLVVETRNKTGSAVTHSRLVKNVPVVEPPDQQDLGVLQNYGFRSKIEWRERFVRFIQGSFTAQELASARVLCLPGIECHHEVAHYLALGIDPANIMGVERSLAHWHTFEANCKKMGIKPIFGDLEDVVKQLSDPINIVSLDFLGGMCNEYFSIVEHLPLADKAVLMCNVREGRESNEIRRRLDQDVRQLTEGIGFQRAAIGIQSAAVTALDTSMGKEINQWATQQINALSSHNPNHTPLKIAASRERSRSGLPGIASRAGCYRNHPWSEKFATARWPDTAEGQKHFTRTSADMVGNVTTFFQMNYIPAILGCIQQKDILSCLSMADIAGMIVANSRAVERLEYHRYQSDAKSHPFYLSIFAELKNIQESYRSVRRVFTPLFEDMFLTVENIRNGKAPGTSFRTSTSNDRDIGHLYIQKSPVDTTIVSIRDLLKAIDVISKEVHRTVEFQFRPPKIQSIE